MINSSSSWLRTVGLCAAAALLTACGGGSSASAPSVTTYMVSATAGTGGGISPASATVDPGSTTQFNVTANAGYVVSGVTGCGGTLSGNTYTTGAVNANCRVTASFVAQYTATANTAAHGALSPASRTVDSGVTTTFTVTPDSGYAISGVTGCGGTLSGNTYTTGAISADCAVTASFSPAFTWVGGPSTGTGPAVYGTLGVGATANLPGPRDKAGTWTDASGSLWLFGGEGLDSTGAYGDLNDLWQYSPSRGEWTWMGGSDTVNATGVYGTQGVAAAANAPGARFGPDTWTDPTGHLWMFGGWSNLGPNQHFNDLWEYSTASGEWTWVGGASAPNQKGVYGTQGVPAPANAPGGRTASATWTDANGNLWLFGGEGYDSVGTYGWLNDLWEYSPATHEWTWIGGSDTTQAQGVYGTRGVPAPSNVPGARAYEPAWTDSSGNVWLFGGVGYDYTTTSYFYFNDLWEYSPTTHEWTWVSGSSSANAPGVYGTEGTAAAANVPGARAGSATWTDASGNLWLLGGYWQNANGSSYSFYNDLWEFSTASGEWTWAGGSSTPGAQGVYGTEGQAATTNVPGARVTPATWMDASGQVWLFGGEGPNSNGTTVDLNDLWRYPTR